MFAVGVSIGSTILTHALAKKPDECSFLKAAAMLWHPSDWSHTSKTLPKAAFGMMDMEFGRRSFAAEKCSRHGSPANMTETSTQRSIRYKPMVVFLVTTFDSCQ